jgi:calcium-dependent protein kinase
MFDKDGSGSISIDEIKGIFGSSEAAVSDEVWKELLDEVDANGDGSV